MVRSTVHRPADDLTIIIPTFNEAESIPALFRGLSENVAGARVIIVDDSPDDSTQDASHRHGPCFSSLDVHVEHRVPEHRHDGLSGAVVEGFRMAKDESIVLVCDADGQHPADTIPSMLAVMNSTGVDIVIASRYIPGGNASGLNSPLRHAVSRACTWLAKAIFPIRLRGVTDPMSGCFLVRRSCVDPDLLQANGFKILFELLVTHQLSHAEVPMRFAARSAGSSKGNFTNGIKFLVQLLQNRFVTKA